MPRDTEADRIARERRAQQQAQTAKAQADAARQAEDQRERDLRAIDDETSRILPLLAKLGYPDMEEVEFKEVSWLRSRFDGLNKVAITDLASRLPGESGNTKTTITATA